MFRYLHNEYDEVFTEVANNAGLHRVRKMTSTQACAMWSDASIPQRCSEIILRHLHHCFGYHVQVPDKYIKDLTSAINTIVPPTFGTYMYHSKKKEQCIDLEHCKKKGNQKLLVIG